MNTLLDTRTVVHIALALVSMLCVLCAYVLCFTDSYFGGYIPFTILSLAPVTCYLLGRGDAPINNSPRTTEG